MLLALTAAGSPSSAEQATDSEALVWVEARARPIDAPEASRGFEGFQFLKARAGAARVVGFGEGIHLSRELLLVRNKLMQYLVEELGFTAIALETGFTDGVIVDDYITGRTTKGWPRVGSCSSKSEPCSDRDRPYGHAFSFLDVALEENAALVEWMREYNARATTRRKLRFYGVSMTGRGEWDSASMTKSIDAALRYVRTVDPKQEQILHARLGPLLEQAVANYDALSKAQRDALTAAIADCVSLFERRRVDWIAQTSRLEFERARRYAANAVFVDADLRTGGAHATAQPNTVSGIDLNQNDTAMADNLLWALQEEGHDGKILVFAHNGHVRKGPEGGDYVFTAMGEHLRAVLGSEYFVIGTTFHDGQTGLPGKIRTLPPSDPATRTGVLAKLGMSNYALDLDGAAMNPQIAAWWSRTASFRVNGGYADLSPLDCFDALIFIRRLSPVRTLAVESPQSRHGGSPSCCSSRSPPVAAGLISSRVRRAARPR